MEQSKEPAATGKQLDSQGDTERESALPRAGRPGLGQTRSWVKIHRKQSDYQKSTQVFFTKPFDVQRISTCPSMSTCNCNHPIFFICLLSSTSWILYHNNTWNEKRIISVKLDTLKDKL